jgi:hypothetical protein
MNCWTYYLKVSWLRTWTENDITGNTWLVQTAVSFCGRELFRMIWNYLSFGKVSYYVMVCLFRTWTLRSLSYSMTVMLAGKLRCFASIPVPFLQNDETVFKPTESPIHRVPGEGGELGARGVNLTCPSFNGEGKSVCSYTGWTKNTPWFQVVIKSKHFGIFL